MTEYEKLLDTAATEGVLIIENFDMGDTRLKGLYCNSTIALSKYMDTDSQRACIMAEELGHHYTSSGDIIDLSDAKNLKQEHKARLWAYNKQIGLSGLIAGFEQGCQSRFELAEFLDVTEDFLEEALYYYTSKYGEYVTLDYYIIRFIPYLMIAKLF